MHERLRLCRNGFTLTELLTVVAVLSVLGATLYPVFSSVREKARQVVCLSNQRQLVQAFMLYAQDFDESLPFFGNQYPGGTIFWHGALRPYYRDPSLLECPSWPKGGKYRNNQGGLVSGSLGFGVNYGTVFAYRFINGRPYRAPTNLAHLEDTSKLLLLTDSQGSSHVYSPVVWPTTVDWDGDGVLDSNAGVLWGEGPYNKGDPFRHTGGSNCAFADGRVRWVEARAWLDNRNHIWTGTVSP